jgi:hypothetical protein
MRPIRCFRKALLLFLAGFAGLLPFVADGQIIVLPGQTIDFYDPLQERVIPDVVDGNVEFLNADAFIGTNPGVVPLSSILHARGLISRANSTVYQYNEITIDEGDGSETVVMSQVSGTVVIRGFMLLVAWGQAEAKVYFEIVDVTMDADDDSNVVTRHPVANYELLNEPSISAGTSLGAKVGSATAGIAGGDLSLGVDIPLSKRIIRDEERFGFTALLRRGHTYRLQLVSESKVKLGRSGGQGIVSMYNPLAEIPPFLVDQDLLSIPPSLLDPQTWTDGLNITLLDKRLPSWSFPDRGIFAWDWFEDFGDTNDILTNFGIPITPRGLINRYFDRVVPDEELTQPGVDLRRMNFTVAPDQIELLTQISQQIETIANQPPLNPPFRPVPNNPLFKP